MDFSGTCGFPPEQRNSTPLGQVPPKTLRQFLSASILATARRIEHPPHCYRLLRRPFTTSNCSRGEQQHEDQNLDCQSRISSRDGSRQRLGQHEASSIAELPVVGAFLHEQARIALTAVPEDHVGSFLIPTPVRRMAGHERSHIAPRPQETKMKKVWVTQQSRSFSG